MTKTSKTPLLMSSALRACLLMSWLCACEQAPAQAPTSTLVASQLKTSTEAKTSLATLTKKQSHMLRRFFSAMRGVVAFSEHRMHLGITQASLALLSVFTVFAFSEHRMHLGIAQASLALLSVFTVFADGMAEFQNETVMCF